MRGAAVFKYVQADLVCTETWPTYEFAMCLHAGEELGEGVFGDSFIKGGAHSTYHLYSCCMKRPWERAKIIAPCPTRTLELK